MDPGNRKESKRPPPADLRSVETGRLLELGALAIIAAAAIARVLGIFSDFWLDEIWSYSHVVSLKSPVEVFTAFRSDNNHLLNSLFMYAVGDTNHWSLYRLLSLGTGLFTIPLVWLVARRNGPVEARLSALLIAASYLLIDYSSEARGYSPAVFFSLAAWYSLQRCRSSGSLRWRGLFWISLGLGLLAHLSVVFVFVAAAVWVPYDCLRKHEPGRRIAREWLSCFGIPVIFSAGLYLLVVRKLEIAGGPDYRLWNILAETLSYAGGEGQFVNAVTIVWGLATAALIGWSIALMARQGRNEWLFYLVVIFLAPAAALAVHRPEVLFVRYFLINIVFGYLALGHLLAELIGKRTPHRAAVWGFLLLFVAGNGFQTARLLRFGRGGYRAAMEYISEHTASNTISIISDHAVRNGKVVEYYRRFLPAPKVVNFLESYPQSSPADWVILHSTVEPPAFGEQVQDPYGNLYYKRRVFQYAGPSGWCWALYSR